MAWSLSPDLSTQMPSSLERSQSPAYISQSFCIPKQPFGQAVEAAKKANNPKTWQEASWQN